MSPEPDLSFVAKSIKDAAIDRGKQELEKKIIENIVPKRTDADSKSAEDGKDTQPKSLEEELIKKGLDKVLDF